jgi:acyl transferase domain-containing protein
MSFDDLKKVAEMSPVKLALLSNEVRATSEAARLALFEPIAIVGIGCRFPGGTENPEEFWKFLEKGGSGIKEMPKSRFDIDQFYDKRRDAPGKMYVKNFGLLDQDVRSFDSEFFGISPKEARELDPQQRLLLECTWEAFEDACINPQKLKGSNTAVFIGQLTPDYYKMLFSNLDGVSLYSATGTSFSVSCGRISYVFGFMGPSVTVETACSSSMVGLHNAVQALRLDECNMAVVGGVASILDPSMTIACCKGSMLSEDGLCKTFDASADGYVRAEGAGVILLKRLSDALASKDRIYALIRGSAVNHGGKASGLTAPNSISQEACIRQALKAGGVLPEQIDFVETHGTGTALGDPIEIQALTNVYGAAKNPGEKYVIGSVKTNIGHLESGSGVAGIIKAALCFEKGMIPKHLNFKKLNPYIDLEKAKAEIPLENTPWPKGTRRRFAGVSSFGFAGTNAHVVLEERPDLPAPGNKYSDLDPIITISAKNQSSLSNLVEKYIRFLEQNTHLNIHDIAYVSNVGRAQFDSRIAIKTDTVENLIKLLRKSLNQENDNRVFMNSGNLEKPSICFLFTGQGAQYSEMGKLFYEKEPIFKTRIDKCAEILKPMGVELLPLLLEPNQKEKLTETINTQPALFAFEYALFHLWKSWGITPSYLTGHSLGEYVAACVADVFTLEEGLWLITERAKLMNSMPEGQTGMAAVVCSVDRANELLKANQIDLEIATYNSPEQIVMAGGIQELERLKIECEKEDIIFKKLTVSHGFHSRAMEPVLNQFENLASSINFRSPKIPIVSNLTGKVLDSTPDAKYWRDHLRSPVRFEQGIKSIYEKGCLYFLELGPQAVLVNIAKQVLKGLGDTKFLVTMKKDLNNMKVLAETLSILYAGGANINWEALHSGREAKKITLPTYAFNHHKKYWFQE